MMARRKACSAAEPERIQAEERERIAAAREVRTAEVQAALEAVLRTVPLSDETRERIAQLWSEGGDADEGRE